MEYFKKNPNLQGLLRFAMEMTQREDPPQLDYEDDKPLDPKMLEEERLFLQHALESLTVDVIKELEKAVKILQDDNASVEDKKEAFDIIREHVVNIDFAISFTKFGGADIIIKYLQAEDVELQILAINTNAELAQNNTFCQKHLHKAGIIEMLLVLMKSENEALASACVYGLSAMTINYKPGLLEFLAKGGINALIANLKTTHDRVFIKTCFLISNLCVQRKELRDEFAKKQTFFKAFEQLDVVDGYDVKIEALLVATKEICQSKEFTINDKQIASITGMLDELVEKIDKLPECEEMLSYANFILRKLNPEKYKVSKTNGVQCEMAETTNANIEQQQLAICANAESVQDTEETASDEGNEETASDEANDDDDDDVDAYESTEEYNPGNELENVRNMRMEVDAENSYYGSNDAYESKEENDSSEDEYESDEDDNAGDDGDDDKTQSETTTTDTDAETKDDEKPPSETATDTTTTTTTDAELKDSTKKQTKTAIDTKCSTEDETDR